MSTAMYYLLAALVSSHAILEFPTSRQTGTQMSFRDVGVKIANFPPTAEQLASCLDSTPSQPKESFTEGQDVTLRWAITIPHTSDPGVR
ncbi:hypothetical protein HDU91_002096, partial [Kappamyces sp. JEL0680]